MKIVIKSIVFMAFFALFSTALNAQTTAPRDSVEVLSEDEIQKLFEQKKSKKKNDNIKFYKKI